MHALTPPSLPPSSMYLPPLSGSTREVRQSYTSQQKDELSVVSGDKVTVLSAPDDGWWVVW